MKRLAHGSPEIPRDPTPTKLRSHRCCVLVVVPASVYLSWLVFGFGGPSVTRAVGDLGLLSAALVATACCVLRGRRETGRIARGWLLLGLATGSWAAGSCIWSYYELVAGRDVPFPSAADVGFLLLVPFAVAAMVTFFRPPHGWTSQFRVLVDSALVASSILFVSWATALGAIWGLGGSPFQQVVGLAYPVGDIVVISIALVVGGRSLPTDNVPIGLLVGGLLALSFSDSAFALLTATGNYSDARLIDVGWFAGFELLALAAVRPGRPVRQGAGRWRGDRTSLPYVPVVLVLLTLLVRLLNDQGLDRFLLANAIVVLGSLVLRQVLSLRENRALTRGLESIVETRTQALSESEEKFRSLIQNVSDVISVVRPDGAILYASPSSLIVLGYPPEELVDLNLFALVHPDDVATIFANCDGAQLTRQSPRRLEIRLRHKSGAWLHTETLAADVIHLPRLGGFVLTTRDVTERKELEQQLSHQALHDSLTALPNRALFTNRMEHSLAAGGRTGRDFAVLYVDLDDFKSVNDSVGHGHGDRVLQEVGRRLQVVVRPGDTVARLGGDEFAVLMEDTSEQSALAVAQRVHDEFAVPVRLDGHELTLNASVGISGSGATTTSALEVLRNAEVAMHQAKSAGKGGTEAFRPEMHDTLVRRVQLHSELSSALERNEFEVYYQPQVDLFAGHILGFEALVRWHHPVRGLLLPGEFIAATEESGLIVSLGEWVFEQAVAQLLAWDDVPALRPRRLTVSVNVSCRQLDSPDFLSRYAQVIEASGLDPDRLTLELTESILFKDSTAAIAKLHELKGLGVRLSIDDFGTGFSSLSRLRNVPVDELKIDKSFVDDIGDSDSNNNERELVRAVIEIGRVLGLDTIAEGVESGEQVDWLLAQGCRLGQGFGFSRPVPAAEAGRLTEAGPLLRIPRGRRDDGGAGQARQHASTSAAGRV